MYTNTDSHLISLRNDMFELAQQLVGIYKVNNMTRSISLQNKDFLVSVLFYNIEIKYIIQKLIILYESPSLSI